MSNRITLKEKSLSLYAFLILGIVKRTFCWKLLGPMFRVFWTPSKRCVEIEITTRCSLACFNCDRSVRQAPSEEDMSLEQIQKFVDESIKLDWRWMRIRLIGGEPTLHPRFFEILEILKPIRRINSRSKIEVCSNGYGRRVNNVLANLPDWVSVRISKKNSNRNKFSSYNIAPMDLEEYQNAKFEGCWIPYASGLGLTRYGYYPCGAGASVDRVFGFNIGQKDLSKLTDSNLRAQLKILCRFCGHYKDNFAEDNVFEEKMSARWKKAYEKYRNAKPALSLY